MTRDFESDLTIRILGQTIAAVAVFDIHIDRKLVVSITPPIIRIGDTPTLHITVSAILL